MRRSAAAALSVWLLGGCFSAPSPLAPGLVGSVGMPNSGVQTGAVELPATGRGFQRYRPLGKKHERYVARVKQKSERLGRVVFVDLTESVLESVGKFVTYALFPDSVYSVVVGLLKNGPKISVGYNPWSGRPLDTDISAICARYGGGGHPVVGGISFPSVALEEARRVARSIASELNGEVAGAA